MFGSFSVGTTFNCLSYCSTFAKMLVRFGETPWCLSRQNWHDTLFKVRFSEHNKNLLARWNQEQLIRLVRRQELRKGLGMLVNHGGSSTIIQYQSTDIIRSWFAEKKVQLPGAWESLCGCNRWSQKLGDRCKVNDRRIGSASTVLQFRGKSERTIQGHWQGAIFSVFGIIHFVGHRKALRSKSFALITGRTSPHSGIKFAGMRLGLKGQHDCIVTRLRSSVSSMPFLVANSRFLLPCN